jgi:hypothetical protein
LLFQLRISVAPEVAEVLGYLHRPVAWRQDLNS